jgi:hypothetical protein
MRIRGSWLMLSSVRMIPTARTMRSRRRRVMGEGPDGGGFDVDDDGDGDGDGEGVDEGVNVDEDVEVDGISGSFGDSGLLFFMLFCLPYHSAGNILPTGMHIPGRLPDIIIVSAETVQTNR